MGLIPYIDPEGDATVDWRDTEVEHWPDGWVPVYSVTDVRVLARIVSNLIPPPAPPEDRSGFRTVPCAAEQPLATVEIESVDDHWEWHAKTEHVEGGGDAPTLMQAVMSGVLFCNGQEQSKVKITTPTETWIVDTPLVASRTRADNKSTAV